MFEIGTNWYVRGDLGFSFDKAPSVSFSNVALPPLGVVGAPFTTGDGARWTTTNFTGGAGFGVSACMAYAMFRCGYRKKVFRNGYCRHVCPLAGDDPILYVETIEFF